MNHHETPALTALESLAAMPPARRAAQVAIARRQLSHALDDSRNLPAAFETLANFGELERTAEGFKNTDPRTLQTRCRRTLDALNRIPS